MATTGTMQFGNSAFVPATINGKCDFLKAILTPRALNVCNASPGYLVIALLAILAMIATMSIAVSIHFATRKDEQKKAAATNGFLKKVQNFGFKKSAKR